MITPPNVYAPAAPAPTYGATYGAATTAMAAGAGEIAVAATGGWSYAPPPGAYGAYAAPSHTYGGACGAHAVPSTTYGSISTGAPVAPAQYAMPFQGAGGWSYAPPLPGADAAFPVA